MKPRLLIVFAILVLLPAGFITALGWRVSQEERHRVQRELVEVVDETLGNTRSSIARVVQDVEDEVFEELGKVGYASEREWRELSRSAPWIRQVFILDGNGEMLFPQAGNPEMQTQREREFLERSRAVWEGGARFGADNQERGLASQGWHSWYWNNGLHLIAWQRMGKSGRIIGAEVERMRLLSEVLAVLPASTPDEQVSNQARVELHNASDRALYGWGEWEPDPEAVPLVETKLSAPLSAWSLVYFSNLPSLKPGMSTATMLNFAGLLLSSVLVSVLLAAYFYREYCRDMREASQRVTFVNQVSHELKTPLTNIRMYAELLDARLDDASEEERRGITVIVNESQRLSRLITNVLTFSRTQQDKVKLQKRPGRIDEAIVEGIDHFRPTLEKAGFEIEVRSKVEGKCFFDADVVEQILANLISNVEKYAAQGKWLQVCSYLEGTTCEIRVCDRGPGIPPDKTEWVFQPFERLSNALSDAAGTGIGLNIARNLARLHGGDVVIEPSKEGACFLVTLNVESP